MNLKLALGYGLRLFPLHPMLYGQRCMESKPLLPVSLQFRAGLVKSSQNEMSLPLLTIKVLGDLISHMLFLGAQSSLFKC